MEAEGFHGRWVWAAVGGRYHLHGRKNQMDVQWGTMRNGLHRDVRSVSEASLAESEKKNNLHGGILAFFVVEAEKEVLTFLKDSVSSSIIDAKHRLAKAFRTHMSAWAIKNILPTCSVL